MTKKRALLSIIGVGVLYALTLGIHSSRFVRAYCKGHEQYSQPKVKVFIEPVYYSWGIPFIYSSYSDALPYPLEITVTVDDRLDGDGVVIESFEAVFQDGDTEKVIRPECPRGGPFGEHTPAPTDQIPGRVFRAARIGIPQALGRRGSFIMSIRGYIYGRQKQPFERKLRMDYEREFNIYTGWRLLAGASC